MFEGTGQFTAASLVLLEVCTLLGGMRPVV